MENKPMPGSYYQPLFDLLHQEHGITPLESEMTDIIFVVEKMRGKQEGPRWVKCSDRLPGYKLGVRWRDGNDHSYATEGVISLFEMDKPNLEGWEWLDEQPAALKQIDREWICDALIEFTIAYIKSNNKDIANDAAEYLDDKLKEVGIVYMLSESEQPAVGREEDAVAFAEWLRSNHHEPTFGNKWVNFSMSGNNRFTTADLYKLWQQSKSK